MGFRANLPGHPPGLVVIEITRVYQRQTWTFPWGFFFFLETQLR